MSFVPHRHAALIAMALAAVSLPVSAHVGLLPAEAASGERVEFSLRVGHGCAGEATTALRVKIPEALENVRVKPKPGWEVEVKTSGPTTAGENHGHGSRVEEIVWTGGTLPDSGYDDFNFLAKVSADATGTIALPTIQNCGEAAQRWIEPAGADYSAPSLSVVPQS